MSGRVEELAWRVSRREWGPAVSARALPQLPGWPVQLMLWGLPVFWLLGLTLIAPLALAAIMCAFLVIRGSTRVVPGVLAYAAFLLWLIPCAVMIDSFGRFMGYLVRYSGFAVAGVAMVYVIAAPATLTRRRLIAGLTSVWCTVVVGGFAGMAFPYAHFATPVGDLLPASLAQNSYVHDLFFPAFAEIQTPWGAPAPFIRPSAPFPYANAWGAAIVLLAPVAVAALMGAKSRLARIILGVSLIAVVVPAIDSSNRGMFLGVAAIAGYVTLRLAGHRRFGVVAGIVLVAIVVAVIAVLTNPGSSIAERQQYGQSLQGRSSLYAETFKRTLGSPILGYGAPRPSLSHEVSAGTQGFIWTVMFSYGFVGLALIVIFMFSVLLRTWSGLDLTGVLLHSVLIGAVVIMSFYGLGMTQLLVVTLVAGILLRDKYAPGGAAGATTIRSP